MGVIYRPNTLPRADLDLFISNLLEIQSKISNENKNMPSGETAGICIFMWRLRTNIN